jgi:hypothetical protein
LFGDHHEVGLRDRMELPPEEAISLALRSGERHRVSDSTLWIERSRHDIRVAVPVGSDLIPLLRIMELLCLSVDAP